MSRVQLALNVTDLEASIAYYETLFGTAPHKVREGYANFAIAEPPLKLVLIENAAAPGGSINHLGVEVATPDEVAVHAGRLADAGLPTDVRTSELCCHAVQDKVWVTDPDGAAWEVYTVTDDAPEAATPPDGAELPMATAGATTSACCS